MIPIFTAPILNLQAVHAQLMTSGQPSIEALTQIREAGCQNVINANSG